MSVSTRNRRYRAPVNLSLLAIALAALGAPAAHAAPPTITDTSVSKVTTTSATLEASINPGAKATLYRFEYGTADCETNPCTAEPDPDAPLGNGTTDVGVSAPVTGLTPGTTYHFRAVARNSDAKDGVFGPDTTFTTFALPPVFDPCPNDPFRTGPSAKLPDCRAYEQVSPLDKNGADVAGGQGQVRASIDGTRITFFTTAGLPGGVGGQDFPLYMASRTSAGWSTQGLLPPPAFGTAALVNGWTPDLDWTFSMGQFANTGALISRSSGGTFSTIFPHTAGADARIVGTSNDGSLVYFQSSGLFAPGAVAGVENLYFWNRDSGQINLAGQIPLAPDTTCGPGPPCAIPAGGAFAGSYHWWQGNLGVSAGEVNYYLQDQFAVSEAGSRVYFTEGGSGRLFIREHAADPTAASTVQVNASKRTDCAGDPTCGGEGQPDPEPDPLGERPAQFQMATPDGKNVFFTSAEELTDDANTGPEQPEPTIARADITTDPPSDLKPDLVSAAAAGIAVDATHIYWADSGNDRIGRAEIGGEGSVEPNFITGADNPQYVTIEGSYIYWTNAADEKPRAGSIGRAELGATDAEEVKQEFIPGFVDEGEPTERVLVDNPRGIDADADFIYWINAGRKGSGSHTIGRAEISGDEPQADFVDTGDFSGRGLAVNSSHIYWTASFDNGASGVVDLIVRRNLDGEPTSQVRLEEDNGNAHGIALASNYLYWVRAATETIARIQLADFDLNPAERSVEPEWIQSDGLMKGLTVNSSHIFWSLNGETPPNPGSDLYRYDAASGDLTDLTSLPGDENGAGVQGVVGVSDDGSHVYFAANGDLDGPSPAASGDCDRTASGRPTGSCSLYHWHNGEIDFIAGIPANDGTIRDLDRGGASNWKPAADGSAGTGFDDRTGRVSADGDVLLFMSQARLTAEDNGGIPTLYRYEAESGELTCASCISSGERPLPISGNTMFPPVSLSQIMPTGQVAPDSGSTTLLRNLSADGDRIYFETTEKLLGADTNGDQGCPRSSGYWQNPACLDVYMWEAQGSGSCQDPDGCVYLISTGTSTSPSFFADASADGSQVFFFTRDQLVPQDTDQIQDVYAASVDGGLAAQHAPPPQICLSGEECRTAGAAPTPLAGAGSAVLEGPGNGAGPADGSCAKFSKLATKKLRAAKRADGKRAGRLRRQAKDLKRKAKRCNGKAAQ